ncbi:MAG: response regulator transcription factor [Bacteroidota bacterium]
MNNQLILIIDDEPQIRKLLSINLESHAFKHIEAENGEIGLKMAMSHNPDLILLDIGLPDISGQEVLKKLRTWFQKPILILSVMDSEEEIIKALDNGANDYLTKPFRAGELMARIRSTLRRNSNLETKDELLEFDDLSINFDSRIIKRNDEILKLTATEYNLLSLFMKNEGRVLTHQYILKEIWGVGHQTDTQYLRVFVGTLRKKIEENPLKPKHIITESGIGYRFC